MSNQRARISDRDPLSATDSVLNSFGQDNLSTSEPVSSMTIKEVKKPPVEVRKYTYQISNSVAEELDRFYLNLRLKLGQRNTPFKEIAVEEALSHWLTWAEQNPEEALEALNARQKERK